MARYFFTGGIMPSDDPLLYFQRDVRLIEHWQVPGWRYTLTSEAWLSNMDRHRAELFPLFERTYGDAGALRWSVCWRVFFMSGASCGPMTAAGSGWYRITCLKSGRVARHGST
jgi:cyclopropane-fatty-acyl-phospholipid synthase